MSVPGCDWLFFCCCVVVAAAAVVVFVPVVVRVGGGGDCIQYASVTKRRGITVKRLFMTKGRAVLACGKGKVGVFE